MERKYQVCPFDGINPTTFFDKEKPARSYAKKCISGGAVKTKIYFTDEYEYEDGEWFELDRDPNEKEYDLSNMDVQTNIEKYGMTYPQARRYAMYNDGISMQEIADREYKKKASIQNSIDLAKDKIYNYDER